MIDHEFRSTHVATTPRDQDFQRTNLQRSTRLSPSLLPPPHPARIIRNRTPSPRSRLGNSSSTLAKLLQHFAYVKCQLLLAQECFPQFVAGGEIRRFEGEGQGFG